MKKSEIHPVFVFLGELGLQPMLLAIDTPTGPALGPWGVLKQVLLSKLQRRNLSLLKILDPDMPGSPFGIGPENVGLIFPMIASHFS